MRKEAADRVSLYSDLGKCATEGACLWLRFEKTTVQERLKHQAGRQTHHPRAAFKKSFLFKWKEKTRILKFTQLQVK